MSSAKELTAPPACRTRFSGRPLASGRPSFPTDRLRCCASDCHVLLADLSGRGGPLACARGWSWLGREASSPFRAARVHAPRALVARALVARADRDRHGGRCFSIEEVAAAAGWPRPYPSNRAPLVEPLLSLLAAHPSCGRRVCSRSVSAAAAVHPHQSPWEFHLQA